MSKSIRKNRWLVQTVILSALLNGVLIAIFFYFFISKTALPTHFDFFPVTSAHQFSPPARQLLSSLSTQTYQTLLAKLTSTRPIEHGYRERDLALAILVQRDHLDLARALGRGVLPKRKLLIDPQNSLTLFPHLEDHEFCKITHFLQTEKYPITPHGLFLQMQISQEPSLLQAFASTPQFHALHVLLARTELPIQKGTLLKMVCEGNWETLENYYQEQKQQCDFSEQPRRQLLLDYLLEGSQTAAYLLLITDLEFASEQLDDQTICQLLDHIPQKTQEAVHFLQTLLKTSSSETVRQQARDQLAQYDGRALTPRPALGELRPTFRDRPPASPDPRLHIIQPGESLWLIAHKYQISIEELMLTNHLQSTVLQPGKTLRIPPPHGTGS